MNFVPEAKLDYHNYKESLSLFDIETYLKHFLEDSYYLGYENVLVITGKGNVVKPVVQRLLKSNSYVKEFKPAGYYNGQDGAFEVVIVS